jgi:ATP-dependent Clp protease ATP-binding subunit ClpA
VLLLDEIEKAHGDVFNLLLQVMDHGTLTDTNGKKADFRHVILLMTSNAGARELATRGIGFDGDVPTGADQKEFERLFSPELRNRLDARIPFRPLTPEVMEQIVEKFVRQLQAQLRERKVTIELSDEARRLLAEEGYDPVFGARPLSRVIDRRIKQPLTDQLLFGPLAGGGTVRVEAADGEIRLRTL